MVRLLRILAVGHNGYRPGIGALHALRDLRRELMAMGGGWVLEADIRSFFDKMIHGHLRSFLDQRVRDGVIRRMIDKWLKAGVMEEGRIHFPEDGSPQGGVISPLLANIYLHHVFDLWVQHWRKHHATGDVIVVRYADDIVAGFQHRADAERFLQEWKDRLRKFGLELHPDKTRLIEFGSHAAEDRKQRGEGKPEVFDFLGFTHLCGKTRKTGRFIVQRKTIRKRLSSKLSELKEELRRRWHQPAAEVGKWLRSVVRGYFNYHAVPGNMDSLNSFRAQVIWRWYRALRRRSQHGRLTWERFLALVGRWIPSAKILHPHPNVRFDAMHPR